MKKYILLFLILYLLFPFSVVVAQELRISSPSRIPGRNELQLLKESTPSIAISPTIQTQVIDTVDSLLRYLNAGVTRLTHIADRISMRREKIGKTGVRITSLTMKQNALTQQINRVKQDMKKTEELSVVFLADTASLNTYQTFRKQLTAVVEGLDVLLKTEKELIANMKQYEVSPSGSLSASPGGQLKITP